MEDMQKITEEQPVPDAITKPAIAAARLSIATEGQVGVDPSGLDWEFITDKVNEDQ